MTLNDLAMKPLNQLTLEEQNNLIKNIREHRRSKPITKTKIIKDKKPKPLKELKISSLNNDEIQRLMEFLQTKK